MSGILRRRTLLARVLPIALIAACSAGAAQPSEWQIETLASAGIGRYSSLKIDAEGNAHLAYVEDDTQNVLKYGFWDHLLKHWFTMYVSRGAQFCSLALDSKQRPRISWVDAGTGAGAKIRYASWDGTAWKIQGLPESNPGAFGFYTSIAMDAKDSPIISFYDYAGPGGVFILRLRTFSWNGSYWEARTVDPEYGSGKFNSIAIDSVGTVHVAYANVSSMRASLRYAHWNGKSWDVEILEGAKEANPYYSVAMTIDKQNVPHITYTDMTRHLVKYATRRSGNWSFQVVGSLRNEAYPDRNGIALDSDGNPYISYYDPGLGELRLAHLKNQKWITEIVDQNFAGFTSSLQIDRGTIWLTYSDENGHGIKCARRTLDNVGLVTQHKPAAPAGTKR